MTMPAQAPRPETGPAIENVTVREALKGKDVTLCYALWRAQGQKKGAVAGVHGLSRQKRDMDFIARFLASRGYDFYSFDAPGRGGSQWLDDPEDYNLAAFAGIFAQALSQMGLHKVHWLGTSMGGLLAMMMAALGHGGYFQTLTLNDITHRPARAGLDRITQYLGETLPVFESPAQYEVFLRQNMPLGNVPDEVWRHYAEHQLVKTDKGYTFHFDPKMMRRALVDLKADVDLSEGLRSISCPVALVAGSVSGLCRREEIGDLKTLKPDAAVFVCEGAGHVPALADDATQQFIRAHIEKA